MAVDRSAGFVAPERERELALLEAQRGLTLQGDLELDGLVHGCGSPFPRSRGAIEQGEDAPAERARARSAGDGSAGRWTSATLRQASRSLRPWAAPRACARPPRARPAYVTRGPACPGCSRRRSARCARG